MIYPESSNDMEDDGRRGKDEMNLAVLPIAKLGRLDDRTTIEYYGTFSDKDGQNEMVWKVRGADGLGLPNDLGERVLVALLYIGAQNDFAERRMEFSLYQILGILGLKEGSRNYRALENAIAQLAGILITSENAWVQKGKDGKLRRARMSKGFHIIDDYTLWNLEDSEERKSYITWGERIWKSIKSGYIKQLDIDFYYSLKNPLARRLYRFLDKMTNYKPSKPYIIDIFALANKLGMVPQEYPSTVKKIIKNAAQELIDRGWMADFEFIQAGNFHRVRFHRCERPEPMLLNLLDSNAGNERESGPYDELWASIVDHFPDERFPRKLAETQILSIENGTATIAAGGFRDWIENRLGDRILKALQREMDDITAVHFVE